MKINSISITSQASLDFELKGTKPITILRGKNSSLALDLVREVIGERNFSCERVDVDGGHFIIHTEVEKGEKNYSVCYIRNAESDGDNRIAVNFKPRSETAESIDCGICDVLNEEKLSENYTEGEKTAQKQKFEPIKGKYRKPGTGCVSKINDNLWEGRYSPKVNGKRMARNVYAHTEEECEVKLAELIKEMKIEIEKLKQGG